MEPVSRRHHCTWRSLSRVDLFLRRWPSPTSRCNPLSSESTPSNQPLPTSKILSRSRSSPGGTCRGQPSSGGAAPERWPHSSIARGSAEWRGSGAGRAWSPARPWWGAIGGGTRPWPLWPAPCLPPRCLALRGRPWRAPSAPHLGLESLGGRRRLEYGGEWSLCGRGASGERPTDGRCTRPCLVDGNGGVGEKNK